MLTAIAIVVLAGAAYWSAQQIAGELRALRDEVFRARAAAMIQTFGPAMTEAARDPRALLAWYPIAKTARAIDPALFASLDRGAERTFPFTADQVQAAHAQWTADWLAWERMHDAEYKLKAAAPEQELAAAGGNPSAIARARLEAVEREKLDAYQRRYQEYVQVAKALQALT